MILAVQQYQELERESEESEDLEDPEAMVDAVVQIRLAYVPSVVNCPKNKILGRFYFWKNTKCCVSHHTHLAIYNIHM